MEMQLKRRIARTMVRLRRNAGLTLTSEFHHLKSVLKCKLDAAKSLYYEISLWGFLKSVPKKSWRFILPKHDETSSFLIHNCWESDPCVIARAFNQHFMTFFLMMMVTTQHPGQHPGLHDVYVESSAILNLLLKLGTKKSGGPDRVTKAFLFRFSEWCSKHLQIIFQESLDTDVVPRARKTVQVTPVHMAGNKQFISNYRPISLTSASCRVLEHILYKHTFDYLLSNAILPSHRHGFLRGFSTTTQLLEFTHFLASAMNDRMQLDAIFLDLSKAFDKVAHAKLLLKSNAIITNERT